MDLPRGYLDDPAWESKIETLPDGSHMLVPDIRKMFDGEGYRYFPPGQRFVEMPPLDGEEAHKFIEFYMKSKRWGLPSGRGWRHETPFAMALLMHLDELGDAIDTWRINQPIGKK